MYANNLVRNAQLPNLEQENHQKLWFQGYQGALNGDPVPNNEIQKRGYLESLKNGATGAPNVKWARKGQMVELCRSNYTGHARAGGGPAPSVIDVRVLQEDEILAEVMEPFFYQISELGQLE
jgi:hypothetical protein